MKKELEQRIEREMELKKLIQTCENTSFNSSFLVLCFIKRKLVSDLTTASKAGKIIARLLLETVRAAVLKNAAYAELPELENKIVYDDGVIITDQENLIICALHGDDAPVAENIRYVYQIPCSNVAKIKIRKSILGYEVIKLFLRSTEESIEKTHKIKFDVWKRRQKEEVVKLIGFLKNLNKQ